mgnify:FL=1
MAQTVINGLDALPEYVGKHLGYSDYITVTQEMVNQFAESTGDHQWIHVDVDRAKAGPFGGPIAHGYLTLSLAPVLIPSVAVVKGATMALNYGANKVRFPTPVPVGAKVRAGVEISEVEAVKGGSQFTYTVTFEIEGAPKPACVAEVVYRYLG